MFIILLLQQLICSVQMPDENCYTMNHVSYKVAG